MMTFLITCRAMKERYPLLRLWRKATRRHEFEYWFREVSVMLHRYEVYKP